MTGSSLRWVRRRARFGATYRRNFGGGCSKRLWFQGEAFRQPLAIYLHDRLERTPDALKAESGTSVAIITVVNTLGS
jgi:hypothetical protein